jgi:hypothetical protein
MWQHLEVAAGPGSLPQLVEAAAAVAAIEQPHEMQQRRQRRTEKQSGMFS